MLIADMLDGVKQLVEGAGVAGLVVKALSSRDVLDDGELRLAPPAAAVFLETGFMSPGSVDGNTYEDAPTFGVIVVAQDLAGGDAPAKAGYAILDALRAYVAGKVIAADAERMKVFLAGYETVAVGGGRATLLLRLRLDGSFQGSR